MVNFPPRQIGPFMSEVLTLGLADQAGAIVLIGPERTVPDGENPRDWPSAAVGTPSLRPAAHNRPQPAWGEVSGSAHRHGLR